jgi:hypothetical protein
MTVKKLACSFAMASDHTARACVAGGGGRATQNADAKPRDFQRSQRLEDFNRSVFTERRRFRQSKRGLVCFRLIAASTRW